MPRSRSSARRRASFIAVSGALTLVLAACGSNIDPETYARANGGTVPGSVAPDGTVVGEVPGADGTLPGADTGGAVSGDAGGGSGAAATGGDTGGAAAGGGAAPEAAGASVKAGDCEGFKNGPGITDDTITLGNASDISGPVPGLFETASDGAKAYVAYFNATNDICGRKLALKSYDSRTDASADQQAYAAGCDEVFAMVGSTSAFDSGGARTAQSCGLPDLRAGSTTRERNSCSTCFGSQGIGPGTFENAVPDFVKKNFGSSASKSAMLFINAGAAAENAKNQVSAMTNRGLKFPYVQGIDISDFNYAPYVQQLKDRKIEVVFWIGAYQQSVRLRQAMQQQGYTPKLYLRDPTDYNPDYVQSGGAAVDGTVVFTNFVPFEEGARNPEMALYLNYLQQVKPGADPAFFGVFAWSAAKLFTEKAIQLGGDLSRASLLAEIKKTNNWTANGLHAPQPVGSKALGDCWRFIQLKGGKWSPIGGTKYTCTGITRA